MTSSKKLWNQADVRAEMNRMVKEATDACKTLHAIAGRIAALGAETNYGADAHAAIEALKKRATIVQKTGWDRLDSIRAGAGGDFGFGHLPGAGETWGSRGCLCGAADKPTSTPGIIHGSATQCPFRPKTGPTKPPYSNGEY